MLLAASDGLGRKCELDEQEVLTFMEHDLALNAMQYWGHGAAADVVVVVELLSSEVKAVEWSHEGIPISLARPDLDCLIPDFSLNL